MSPTTQHGMTEQRLKTIEFSAIGDEQELITEVRRLQQREADLETALNLQEGLYRELQAESVHPLDPDYPLPSFLIQEPKDDHGEYARGVRV